MRKLLTNLRRYVSTNGYLNSDGRKLLNDLVRELARNKSALTRMAKEVRKDPSLSKVIKLGEALLGSEALELLYSNFPEEGIPEG